MLHKIKGMPSVSANLFPSKKIRVNAPKAVDVFIFLRYG
jgi:hypothetical protein